MSAETPAKVIGTVDPNQWDVLANSETHSAERLTLMHQLGATASGNEVALLVVNDEVNPDASRAVDFVTLSYDKPADRINPKNYDKYGLQTPGEAMTKLAQENAKRIEDFIAGNSTDYTLGSHSGGQAGSR
jgi:hypothetical protein